MKLIAKIFILGSLAASAAACADLDMDSDGRLQMKDIFSRQDRTAKMFANLSKSLPKTTLTYGKTTTPLLAGFSDEAEDSNDGITHVVSDWYHGRVSATSNPLTSKCIDPWTLYFGAIYKCNNFIKNIQDPTIATYPFDTNQKEGWIAQAKVLRAYYYWQLVKRYGGVPLATEPYPMGYDFANSYRASFEECADFIIGQCDEALACPETENLSVGFKWVDNSRTDMTRFIAHAIKSEVALYAASPLNNPDNSGKYTWDKAAEITKAALDACISHGAELFKTVPEASSAINAYDNYFITRSDPSRINDKETFLESGTRLKIWEYAGTPMNTAMKEAGPCPSQELVDCYDMADGSEPILGYLDADHLQPNINAASGYDDENPYANRDPRFYASIYYNGCQRNLNDPASLLYTHVGGNCGISDKATDVRFTRTGYYMRKFNNYKSNSANATDGFMPLFRLAELYLNFAEAAYQSAGPDQQVGGMSAREAVNIVRERVGMPGLPAGLSKADFERRYRKERRVELAFEDHRYYDVRRWKILEQTDRFVTGMKITKNNDGTFKYQRIRLADRKCSDAKFYLYPVNQTDVSKMLQISGQNWQNPGWE